MTEIRFFRRDRARYPFLSNFYPAVIQDGGQAWPTAEHLYQACKTEDEAERQRIREAGTPGGAKRLGRSVALRPNWLADRQAWMTYVVTKKFRQHPDLAARLVATGDAVLIEDSPFDRSWGIGRDGTGENRLGRILMDVRAALRDGRLIPCPVSPTTAQS